MNGDDDPLATLRLVVLVGGTQLAEVIVELQPLAASAAIPAPLPLHTVLSFVDRHARRSGVSQPLAERKHLRG
jgi:hypothetical protein